MNKKSLMDKQAKEIGEAVTALRWEVEKSRRMEIKFLLKQNARLKKDKRRMDFMTRHGASALYTFGVWQFGDFEGISLRRTIDKQLKKGVRRDS